MTDLRVLHFHFGREGGAERFFVNLAQGLARRGVEQRFVIRPDRTWHDDVTRLGPVMQTNFTNIIRATGLIQWRVARLCRDWQPDAIMAWMPRASKLLPARTSAIRVTRLGDFPANLKHFGKTDVLLGNLPGIISRARDLGWDRETRVISNFPRSVEPHPLPRQQFDTPEDAFLVAAGGRFVPRKGLDVAIRAVAKIPDAWLWLMGEGPEQASLRALAAELGVADRVRFTGWLPEPINGIAAADAFLMPSRHEPLGNMLLEAWQAGVPTVSTRSEGPSWFMRADMDGVLTEIDDVEAIAAGLMSIRDNPERAQSFVKSAKERLDEMFSEDAVLDAYIELLSSRQRDPDA